MSRLDIEAAWASLRAAASAERFSGGLHVYVPALKGCHSWGATRQEARENVKEAIELWLDSACQRIT